MHDNGFVEEFRLRPRRADHDRAVFEIIERSFLFLVLYLVVGKRGMAARAPIHDPVAAIDEPVVIHHFEHGFHGHGKIGIEGVARARPVARGSHTAYLRFNAMACALHELVDSLH